MLSGPIQVLLTPVPDDRLRFQVAYEKRCAWSTETLFFFLARGTQRQFAPTYIENTFFIIIVMIIVITVNNHTTPHSHPRRQTILSTASHAKGLRDDLQRRFPAQQSVAILLRHYFEQFQYFSNIATKFCATNYRAVRIAPCNSSLPRPFYFWGRRDMGDFREEYPADWFRGKKCCKENRKYLWKTYILSAQNKKILWRIMLREKSLIPATTKIKCSRISTHLVCPVGGTVGGSCRLPSWLPLISRARDHEPEFQDGTPGSFFEETGKCKRRGENWRTGILSASAFAFEHFTYIFADLILGKISILWFV